MLDRDVSKNDDLGSFVLTLETLQDIAASKTPLALHRADKMVLGPVEVR